MQLTQLSGQLLLASPSLKDPNFQKSVVLVCHHNREGAMGLIINRPRPLSMLELLNELKIPVRDDPRTSDELRQRRVFDGGPVDVFRGFILHDSWHVFDSTMRINDELHLTASLDLLEALGQGEGPEHYMMMLGYAGWGAGQLESELAENDWLVAPASHRIIFVEPPERRWEYGARCLGIDPLQLSDQIGHA